MSIMMLTAEASFFLLKVNLGLSAKTIAELSIPHFDYHEETLRSLAKQSIDTRVGLFLLIISVVLQISNTLWPLSYNDFGIDWRGVLISIAFCIVVLVISYLYARHNSKKLFEQSMQIIKTRRRK
jgi:uncharacterized membrane protein